MEFCIFIFKALKIMEKCIFLYQVIESHGISLKPQNCSLEIVQKCTKVSTICTKSGCITLEKVMEFLFLSHGKSRNVFAQKV